MDIKQLEPLKEMASIGAGNGATAISKMLKEEVKIDPPELELIKVENVQTSIGKKDEKSTLILSQLEGGLSGAVFFIFNPTTADQITQILTKKPELNDSALNELANIFLGNALKAVSDFLQLHISHTVTHLVTDMLGAVIDPVIARIGESAEEVLVIKINFTIRDLSFKVLFLADPQSTVRVEDKLSNWKNNGT